MRKMCDALFPKQNADHLHVQQLRHWVHTLSYLLALIFFSHFLLLICFLFHNFSSHFQMNREQNKMWKKKLTFINDFRLRLHNTLMKHKAFNGDLPFLYSFTAGKHWIFCVKKMTNCRIVITHCTSILIRIIELNGDSNHQKMFLINHEQNTMWRSTNRSMDFLLNFFFLFYIKSVSLSDRITFASGLLWVKSRLRLI